MGRIERIGACFESLKSLNLLKPLKESSEFSPTEFQGYQGFSGSIFSADQEPGVDTMADLADDAGRGGGVGRWSEGKTLYQ